MLVPEPRFEWPFEIAHAIGLVPLLWLIGLAWQRDNRDAAYWWLATAFGVSFLADTAAHFVNPGVTGNVYPLLQAGLVGCVLLDRVEIQVLLITLGIVGAGAVLWLDTGGYVPLHTVAWLGTAGIVYQSQVLGPLRWSLIMTFGVGWLFWLLYAAHPGWFGWGLYQLTRVAGMALFCAAALHPSPPLRLVRHAA